MFPTYFVGQVKSRKEMMQINSRIKQKHDTLANWTSNNIVLLDGELAVVDCGNQTKFKVGNGISSFTQLPFIDEHVLSTIWVTTHAISQGTQAHSTPFGLAAGWRLSANANYSQALGFKSQTSASHDFSFVWNGDDTSYSILGEDYYSSHGKGSFNINPLSGLSGVFVGEQNLAELLDSNSGNTITIDDHISGTCQQSDLSIVRLPSNEYEQLSANHQLLSNALYVVEDSFTNNYGKQIKNVAEPTDISDAATKGYVDDAIPNDLSDLSNSPGYVTSASISSSLADIQKSVFESISNPAASVRSLQETLISVLNILRGLK